jgi:hypothetical protein
MARGPLRSGPHKAPAASPNIVALRTTDIEPARTPGLASVQNDPAKGFTIQLRMWDGMRAEMLSEQQFGIQNSSLERRGGGDGGIVPTELKGKQLQRLRTCRLWACVPLLCAAVDPMRCVQSGDASQTGCGAATLSSWSLVSKGIDVRIRTLRQSLSSSLAGKVLRYGLSCVRSRLEHSPTCAGARGFGLLNEVNPETGG